MGKALTLAKVKFYFDFILYSTFFVTICIFLLFSFFFEKKNEEKKAEMWTIFSLKKSA
jgi:hypothetical protein